MKRIGILIFLLLLLSACKTVEARQVTGSERDSVLSYSEPKADLVLSAIQAHNFKLLEPELDPTFHTVFDQSAFDAMVANLDAKIGACTTRQVMRVYEQGYMNVVYTLSCSKDAPVDFQLEFEVEEPHRIGGIFFNSPTLEGY